MNIKYSKDTTNNGKGINYLGQMDKISFLNVAEYLPPKALENLALANKACNNNVKFAIQERKHLQNRIWGTPLNFENIDFKELEKYPATHQTQGITTKTIETIKNILKDITILNENLYKNTIHPLQRLLLCTIAIAARLEITGELNEVKNINKFTKSITIGECLAEKIILNVFDGGETNQTGLIGSETFEGAVSRAFQQLFQKEINEHFSLNALFPIRNEFNKNMAYDDIKIEIIVAVLNYLPKLSVFDQNKINVDLLRKTIAPNDKKNLAYSFLEKMTNDAFTLIPYTQSFISLVLELLNPTPKSQPQPQQQSTWSWLKNGISGAIEYVTPKFSSGSNFDDN